MKNQQQNIQWWQINNIITLIGSAVMMTLTYGLLMTRVAVLENKVDTLIIAQERMLIKYSEVETRYGTLSLQVARLETKATK